jgi:dynein heavy chain
MQAGSVESLGSKLGFTTDAGRYVSVSLGQGQEPIAMNALANAHKNGGWVLLQNIHLTIDWTGGPLEKRVDKLAEGAHPDFRWAWRCIISASLHLQHAACFALVCSPCLAPA